MYVFIDTNVFLSFYHLTSEDLEELKKLVVLIENKEISLLLPQQVVDETWRNRANKIKDALEPFKKAKFNPSFPAYCKDYPQYEEIRKALREAEELHSAMVAAIQADIAKKELAADKLITKLFEIAKRIQRTDQIIEAARTRRAIGNPPGKKDSLGDAINWESLRAATPNYLNLYMIADDSDFYSPLDSNEVNDFLKEEWNATKKEGGIFFYRKLSDFFKKHFPNINLQTELEKDACIASLATSPNFYTTHTQIAKLAQYDGFTLKQTEDLFDALLNNNQVRWIIGDDDVYTFYHKLFLDSWILDHFEEISKLLKEARAAAESEENSEPTF